MAVVIIAFIAAYLFFDIIHHMPPITPGDLTPSLYPTPIDNPPVNDSTYGGLQYRWVYVRYELDVPGNLEKVENVMRRAKAAGYNGIVFSNIWSTNNFENLGQASPEYLQKLNAVKDAARDDGLAMYPTVLTVGYASPILAQNPNLAEGLPVKNALFVVQNGKADIQADPYVSLPGGDFEKATNNVFEGWDSQNWPGTNTFADTSVVHSGGQSLRVETKGISRIYKTVDVSPFRQYHLSMWVKTQDVKDTKAMEPSIVGADDNMVLSYMGDDFQPTQDWTHYDIVFNSLNNSKVALSFGTWDWTGGTIWIDDVTLNEIGLTNIIRRSDYPLVVKGEDGTVYQEGTDFQYVQDPQLGRFDVYHASPSIILTANSRIKEGQRLRVSFYAVGMTYSGQVAISLTSPDAQKLFTDEITRVNNALNPSGMLINYNEIRVGNWQVRPTPMTEGQAIASSFEYDDNFIHQTSPNLKVFVWNDMFDPYHNAHDNYYLDNGTVDGSYEGLGSDVVVVNWNYLAANRTKSMEFFTGRGNSQILAGYYDGDAPPINQWLDEAHSVNASVDGVMYTTWNDNYDDLETFAQEAWGG